MKSSKNKVEKMIALYEKAEELFKKKEQEALNQIAQKEHKNHFLFQLLQNGTKKDKMTSV